MKEFRMKIVVYVMAAIMLTSTLVLIPAEYNTIIAEAHSGRTDASGGHKDNKNKSGLGSYHYHCDGNPAHLHDNGTCPYAGTADTADTATITDGTSAAKDTGKATTAQSTPSKQTVKAVQEALNALSYDCGKADGIAGKKTVKAIKQYQADQQITETGKIDDALLKALEITAE